MLNFLRRYWPLIPIVVLFAAAVSREWSNKNTPQPPLQAAAPQIPPLAALQPPVPSAGKATQQQQNATPKPNVSADNNAAPNNGAASPNLTFSPEIGVKTGDSANGGEQKSSADWWLVGVTIGLLFAAFLTYFTLRKQASIMEGTLTQMGIDARLARDEFNATHRPQLEVRFVRPVTDGAEITIINTGTSAAKFVSARAILVPVETGAAIPSPHDIPIEGTFRLRPRFEPSELDRYTVTETPDAFGTGFGGDRLYVFGWIVYDTEAPTPIRRTTYFGRKIEHMQPDLIALESTDWNFIQ